MDDLKNFWILIIKGGRGFLRPMFTALQKFKNKVLRCLAEQLYIVFIASVYK